MSQSFIAVVQLCVEHVQTYVFIDSRKDGKTISYEFFEQLKHLELKATRITFQSYIGQTSKTLSICNICLCVSKLICKDKFFVTTQLKLHYVPIILGRIRQRKYIYFYWQPKLAHCQSDNNFLLGAITSIEGESCQQCA